MVTRLFLFLIINNMRRFYSFLLLAAITKAIYAQTINGDLNHNDFLDTDDIILLIDGYLTGETEVINSNSDYYKVDNSLIVGTWYASKSNSIVFEADGTYGGGFPYKFIPAQGEILMFDNDGNVVDDFRVIYLTDNEMVIKRNDGTYQKMTRTRPSQLVTSITLSKSYLTMQPEDLVRLKATVKPSDADNNEVIWTSSDEDVATVSSTGVVEAMRKGRTIITCAAADSSGVTATCIVTVITEPEAVDLGLSVKWATMNIGANSPEEYGDYFAWGETVPKSEYSSKTYKWCQGSDETLTKYNDDSSRGIVDNKTTLEFDDDAARANWGGTWRMPTYHELAELESKCTWIWTSKNGVEGVEAKGPNGKSIFFPARKQYWSSTVGRTPYSHMADYLNVYSNEFGIYGSFRSAGRCVRAVCP